MPVDTKALAEAVGRLSEYANDDILTGTRTQANLRLLLSALAEARDALGPFAAVSTAYANSELDEHRPEWGIRDHEQIELLQGRGGKRLLTLEHARRAASLHTTLNEALKEKADG